MEKEFSCGSVVYKLTEGTYQFLLIKHKNGGHISFPKGHMEGEETEVETALREVYEETGISIKIDETIKKEIIYEPRKDVKKKVTFFLGEAHTVNTIKQEEEVSEVYWMNRDEVLENLTYETDKEVFLELTKDLKVKKNIHFYEFLIVIAFTLGIVALTDVLHWGYAYKAAFKLLMFVGIPYAYTKIRVFDLNDAFKIKKKDFLIFLGIGIAIYGIVLGGYFILRNWMDFSNIPGELEKNLGITESNFIYVFMYIPLVNALLEEFFFRVFTLSGIKKFMKPIYAMIISATFFSIYHFAIIGTWVNIWIVLSALLGLFSVGLVFGYLAHKKKSIYPTYIIHFFANLAINTAALFILGII